jgi:flagellar hook-associated protein 2
MTTTSNLGFGSLNTGSSGSTSLGTTLFGVDVTKLVDSLVQARGLTNTRRQDKIDGNTEKLSAYATMQTKLEALRTAANPLRTPRVLSGDTNVFNTKQTLSTASGTIAASALVGVSAAENAEIGTHSLTINRIATADTITSSLSLPDSTSTVPLTANTTLTLGGVNVDLTNTMSLTQIRDAINAKKSSSGVVASIVQASASSYRMVLKSDTTGKAITLSDDLGGAGLTELGLAASGATDTSLSADLVVDGVSAIRSTNSISDLIDGLSLELFQADVGKPVSIQVSNNLTGISDAVTSFVTAYNDFVDFVKSQRAVSSDGTVGADQVLFNDNLLQTNYRNIQGIMSIGANGISTGALKTLNDVGIELGSDGKLTVKDSTKFEDSLLSKLDEVKNLFGFGSDASPGLSVVDRPDFIPTALVGKTVTVNITATDGSGIPTAASFTVDGNTVAAVITNGFIRGADGTDLEDFRIGYEGGVVGGTPYTGTFTPTQGIADQIAGALETVLDPQNGDIKNTTSTLTDTNTRLKDQIDTLTKQLEIYRARMLSQFQAAQNAISALESAQNSIKSYTDSLNSNN